MKSKQIISAFIAFALALNPYAFAYDISPDTSSSNSPTVKTAPNGNVPLIDIVKPNEQGLSHNKFKDYNVNKEGVILNNSNKAVDTKLAGSIESNPNLAQSAKVILNEITGTKKSNLLGYTEVAGDRADVIIANPNGIYVNGGGFINVNAATLTTGELKFQNGLLNGFDVNRGDIVIDGLGFNADNIDRVNLYSKTLYLNAKLHANDLNIVLGNNDISNDGSFVSKDASDTGLSLDSSSLGGIYANTIYLTSSDKGVGVNLPPEVLSAHTLTLNVNGDLSVDGVVSSHDDMNITSNGAITGGHFISNSDINIASDDDINLLNTDIAADKNVNIIASKDVTIGSIEEKEEFDSGYGITNRGSNINGSNINIRADNILIDASNLKADDTVSLEAKNDIDILAKNDVLYTESETADSSFLNKETSKQTSYHETAVSSNLNADNILINAGSSVTLEAAKLKAQNDIYIDAEESINIEAKLTKDAQSSAHSKSSWGGKSSDFEESEALTLSSSQIEGGDITLDAGDDINIIASDITSAGDLKLKAFDDVLISAGNEKLALNSTDKNAYLNPLNIVGSLFTSGSIYKNDIVEDTIYSVTAKSSNLNSGNNIIIKSGKADIAGSNLKADNNIEIAANEINILTTEELIDALHREQHIDARLVNVKDITKDTIGDIKSIIEYLIGKSEDETSRLKVRVAFALFDNEKNTSKALNHAGSNLQANNGDIVLDSLNDITITGSNLEAINAAIYLDSKTGDIVIKEAINTKNDTSQKWRAEANASAIVQNEYAEALFAVKRAVDSAKGLKDTIEDYIDYKKEIKSLENELSDLKRKYKNHEDGVTQEDIDNLEKVIDNTKGKDKSYLSAITASAKDLGAKTTAIPLQTASAAASSATLGFSVGLSLNLSGSLTEASSVAANPLSSNLIAKEIYLSTNIADDLTYTTISGSNLQASDSINIQTGVLNTPSSKDTFASSQNTKELTGSFTTTMYGGAAGEGISVKYNKSDSNDGYTNDINSTIVSDNIIINEKNN